ncbi:hypothetical protein [uncultured Methylobacterium sp.]|jgi:hypothetical protein|uniref:hypothetical protein n=1 Tax=uncultured Methylobacterium sp. TaxID=157278 RepID=UPI002627D2CB|nr:hypothetical protein [uncultured Methylobacterium sp.]
MSSKQPKTTTPTDADLKGNPGIGGSAGTTLSGGDPEDLEGANTYEGDVDNDTTPEGGIDPDQRPRKNK